MNNNIEVRRNKIRSKVYVKESLIHGHGLFARENIKSEEIIGHVKGKRTDVNGPYVLWVDDQIGIDVSCHLRFINHSDYPNACYYDSLEVIATRDIKKDEEITHDYGAGL